MLVVMFSILLSAIAGIAFHSWLQKGPQRKFFDASKNSELQRCSLEEFKAQRQQLEGLVARLNARISSRAKEDAKAVMAHVNHLAQLPRGEKRLACLKLFPRLSEEALEAALSQPLYVLKNLFLASQPKEVQIALTTLFVEQFLQLSLEEVWNKRIQIEHEIERHRQEACVLRRNRSLNACEKTIVRTLALSIKQNADLKKEVQTACAPMRGEEKTKFLLFSVLFVQDSSLATQAIEGVIWAAPALFSKIPALPRDEEVALQMALRRYNDPKVFESFLLNTSIAHSCEKNNCIYLIDASMQTCNLAALYVFLKHRVDALEFQQKEASKPCKL